MKAVKVLIVEDELIIAENIASKLRQTGYTITACVVNGREAFDSVGSVPPDVIFMDIMLAGKEDGIETALELKKLGSWPIIFLTNMSDDHSFKRAQGAGLSDYILKSSIGDGKQLHFSIQKALAEKETDELELIDKEPDQIQEAVFVRDKGGYKKVAIDHILYLEAQRSYSCIHTDKEELTQSIPLKDLYKRITHPKILRIHNSYAINLDKVERLKGNVVVLQNKELPVGREYKEELQKRIRFI